MSDSINNQQHYPIRAVSQETGINSVTLRAWERRYGIIKPHRTPKGHRYYTDDHIETINNIVKWLDKGYPIRQVKELLLKNDPIEDSSDDNWKQQRQKLLQNIHTLNFSRLDGLINEGMANYPAALFVEYCLLPLLNDVRQDDVPPVLTKAFELWVFKKFCSLLHIQQKSSQGQPILVGCNDNDANLDALFIAYCLSISGYRVQYFDGRFSPSELSLAANVINADAVWIHFSKHSQDDIQRWQDSPILQDRLSMTTGSSTATEKTLQDQLNVFTAQLSPTEERSNDD